MQEGTQSQAAQMRVKLNPSAFPSLEESSKTAYRKGKRRNRDQKGSLGRQSDINPDSMPTFITEAQEVLEEAIQTKTVETNAALAEDTHKEILPQAGIAELHNEAFTQDKEKNVLTNEIANANMTGHPMHSRGLSRHSVSSRRVLNPMMAPGPMNEQVYAMPVQHPENGYPSPLAGYQHNQGLAPYPQSCYSQHETSFPQTCVNPLYDPTGSVPVAWTPYPPQYWPQPEQQQVFYGLQAEYYGPQPMPHGGQLGHYEEHPGFHASYQPQPVYGNPYQGHRNTPVSGAHLRDTLNGVMQRELLTPVSTSRDEMASSDRTGRSLDVEVSSNGVHRREFIDLGSTQQSEDIQGPLNATPSRVAYNGNPQERHNEHLLQSVNASGRQRAAADHGTFDGTPTRSQASRTEPRFRPG